MRIPACPRIPGNEQTTMPKLIFSIAFFAFLIGLVACANPTASVVATEVPATHVPATRAPQIQLENVWARSTPELQNGSGVVYMTLTNSGQQADRLVAGKTTVAKAVELHEHIADANGVYHMQMIEGGFIDLPAGGTVELKSGGIHLMLIHLTHGLEAGTSFTMTLKFQKAGEMTLQVPVRDN